MKLTVFNGSGRGKRSNTAILLDAFLQGFSSVDGCTHEVHTLMQKGQMETFTNAFAEAEHVLMAFPMYTDMVPGIVKAFIETLEPYCDRDNNPSLGFIIHCGFPEGIQLRALEHYLEKLSRRLGCCYTGTVLKGNSEGLRDTPAEKMSDFLQSIEALGQNYAQNGELDEETIANLAQPERFNGLTTFLFSILALTPLVNIGWNKDLKKNSAFQKRFARPYAED